MILIILWFVLFPFGIACLCYNKTKRDGLAFVGLIITIFFSFLGGIIFYACLKTYDKDKAELEKRQLQELREKQGDLL